MRKVLLLLLFCNAVFGQTPKINKENPFFTVRGVIGIPRSTGSMMFRQSFSGIYEANLAIVFNPGKNFLVGIGYQNALFKNHKSFVFLKTGSGSLSYNTQIIENGAFVKLGYDHFVNELTYFNYSLNSGIMLCKYTGIIADTSLANRPYGNTSFSAPYVQPEISVNFLAGEKQELSFSLLLSYTTMFYKFDPKAPRFNHFGDPTAIYTKGNRYFMNWINIGLGFNILIRGKSKASAG